MREVMVGPTHIIMRTSSSVSFLPQGKGNDSYRDPRTNACLNRVMRIHERLPASGIWQ